MTEPQSQPTSSSTPTPAASLPPRISHSIPLTPSQQVERKKRILAFILDDLSKPHDNLLRRIYYHLMVSRYPTSWYKHNLEHADACIVHIKIHNERFPDKPKPYLKQIGEEAMKRKEVLREEREKGGSEKMEDVLEGFGNLDFGGMGELLGGFEGLVVREDGE